MPEGHVKVAERHVQISRRHLSTVSHKMSEKQVEVPQKHLKMSGDILCVCVGFFLEGGVVSTTYFQWKKCFHHLDLACCLPFLESRKVVLQKAGDTMAFAICFSTPFALCTLKSRKAHMGATHTCAV